MKTMEDVEKRLLMELEQWRVRQTGDKEGDFYLYCLPGTEKHNGGLFIARHVRNKAFNEQCPIDKNLSILENFEKIKKSGVLRSIIVIVDGGS